MIADQHGGLVEYESLDWEGRCGRQNAWNSATVARSANRPDWIQPVGVTRMSSITESVSASALSPPTSKSVGYCSPMLLAGNTLYCGSPGWPREVYPATKDESSKASSTAPAAPSVTVTTNGVYSSWLGTNRTDRVAAGTRLARETNGSCSQVIS